MISLKCTNTTKMPTSLSNYLLVKTYLISLFLLTGCRQECYPEARYFNYTDLEWPSSGWSERDSIILHRVEACLKPLKNDWLTNDELAQAECIGAPTLELRSCLRIGTPEYIISKCSGEELFACSVPDESCKMKGLTPTADCPCMCRAMIQDNTVIWTTPNRKLLPAYAVTIMTGCVNPWEVPRLAACSNPALAE
jgi:hypothetical protein